MTVWLVFDVEAFFDVMKPLFVLDLVLLSDGLTVGWLLVFGSAR